MKYQSLDRFLPFPPKCELTARFFMPTNQMQIYGSLMFSTNMRLWEKPRKIKTGRTMKNVAFSRSYLFAIMAFFHRSPLGICFFAAFSVLVVFGGRSATSLLRVREREREREREGTNAQQCGQTEIGRKEGNCTQKKRNGDRKKKGRKSCGGGLLSYSDPECCDVPRDVVLCCGGGGPRLLLYAVCVGPPPPFFGVVVVVSGEDSPSGYEIRQLFIRARNLCNSSVRYVLYVAHDLVGNLVGKIGESLLLRPSTDQPSFLT